MAETDLDDVLEAIRGVKHAVEIKTTTAGALVWVFIAMLVWSWLDSAWHSRLRYSAQYDVPAAKITVEDKPHDCNFFAAPLGSKYCHHERAVQAVYWATSTTGTPIVSYDDGKTWSTFTPDAGVNVPQYKTLESVYIGWEKKPD